jgi:hypothetical protein
MTNTAKIINTILILFAAFMGLKQGWAMLSAKPAMTNMLAKLGLTRPSITGLGLITLISVILMIIPRTFFYGNFLMAASILFILMLELQHRELKAAVIEVPFLLLSCIILYLRHPLAPTS